MTFFVRLIRSVASWPLRNHQTNAVSCLLSTVFPEKPGTTSDADAPAMVAPFTGVSKNPPILRDPCSTGTIFGLSEGVVDTPQAIRYLSPQTSSSQSPAPNTSC